MISREEIERLIDDLETQIRRLNHLEMIDNRDYIRGLKYAIKCLKELL